jgi:RNA polymerase sigma-B factor
VTRANAPDDAGALGDLLGDDGTAFSLVVTRELVADAERALSVTERKVVKMRVVGGLTQREIGERIGYSQMHVSRVLRQALDRLTEAGGLTSLSSS